MLAVLPRVVWMPGGVRTEVHVGAAETGGAMTMLVDHPLEGWSVPMHRHRREAETIHVVAGHFQMTIGGETMMLSPGESVHIPAGVPHDGRLLGGGGERVVTFTPGGMEDFFLAAGTRHPTASADLSRVLSVAAAHGWEFL